MRGSAEEGELLPYLDTFARAAEENNFTKAAKALGLTQAAVSQRVQILERLLGKPLFQRRGGRVLLSDAGRTLYDYAQRMLDLDREARRALTGSAPPLTGSLRLAASSVPGEHLLPELLTAFGKRYPGIRVQATVSDSDAVAEQVVSGEAHLGMVGRRMRLAHLESRMFARDRLVVVVPAGHPLARNKQIRADRLAQLPLIHREVGSGTRHSLERALDQAGFGGLELQVAMELGSNEAVKQAVLRGVGAAVLSDRVVEKERRAGKVAVLELRDVPCERELYVVRDRRRVLPAPARLFLNYLDAQATLNDHKHNL